MAKEWIDVADTAVKIGLGALITGFFTYLGVKFSHKSEQKKFFVEHKVKVIEEISIQSDEYFSAWNNLINKVAGIVKCLTHDEETLELKQKQITSIRAVDAQLVTAWSQKQAALTKLRLLQANDSEKALLKCSNKEKELRDMIIFDKQYPNYSKISKYRNEAKECQKKYLEALAKTYESISK
ncbi:hypothetical protein BT051_RS20070 [Vibrio alginolyticus]|nr:hypothetical protein [Vibrio alginolyticus]